jgi:hypothetical protein
MHTRKSISKKDAAILARYSNQRTGGSIYNNYVISKDGRYRPSDNRIALCNMNRRLRDMLVRDTHVFVERPDCYLSILCQLCTHNLFPEELTQPLFYYRAHTEERHLDITKHYGVDAVAAKSLFTSLLLNRKNAVQQWKKKHHITDTYVPMFVRRFEHMILEMSYLFVNDDNKKVPISLLIYEVARDITDLCAFYCEENDYIYKNFFTPCDDGILLHRRGYRDSLPAELTAFVKEVIGYDIFFHEAPMDQGYDLSHAAI